MEVADQWRRQWAGTAEYGKVTEGGVTRRVARAMEVLHASGPGARVRVMRAAYHSSAGPGVPAESFMLHSSRRVISSGFNFSEPPLLPIKPLEISSTPLQITHDPNEEIENYKVTEPDDLEISEPSKWRGSTTGSSIRMPSEESSSTDNASIIDLDSRNSRNLHRKCSYDSESSDIPFRSRSNSKNSQILDAPTTLSTLKYKSLLNSSNEWMRRKSYSFEDTSPLNETILHNNATLAMESSTDSGICKSTEIVNDYIDENSYIKDERKTNDKEESFRDWLSKNRPNSQYKGTKFKTYRDHDIVIEDPKENNIALQSSGKLVITLPITVESNHDSNSRKIQQSEDVDRRIKKVEFCKTELHFAADSGKVNIIATDDKPPPTNDFRKRRSAFVPMQNIVDKPITLFGDKNDFPVNGVSTSLGHSNSDFSEFDENTAATKSILKNKIPKPKPYLLGENMDFGFSTEIENKTTNKPLLTAVSLVNQQMESEKWYKGEKKSLYSTETEKNGINSNTFRTINPGPTKNDSPKHEKHVVTNIKIENDRDDTTEDIKNKLSFSKSSHTQVKPKTRQLRKSDLTYFGIDNDRKVQKENRMKPIESKLTNENVSENIFHSVKLIQQVSNSVSNSVCNSEPEFEDGPEYQNIPLNINCAPVPTPRMRLKYSDTPNEIAVVRAGLRPIIEKVGEEVKDTVKPYTRRTKIRRQTEIKPSRSLSEPPKNFKRNSQESSSQRGQKSSYNKDKLIEENAIDLAIVYNKVLENDVPIYANLIDTIQSSPTSIEKHSKPSLQTKESQKTSPIKTKIEKNAGIKHRTDSGTDNSLRKKYSVNKDTISSSLRKEQKSICSDKNYKSQYNDTRKKINDELSDTKNLKTRENKHNSLENNKSERNGRSLQKALPKISSEASSDRNHDHNDMHRDTSSNRKRNTSKDKINSVRENVKTSIKLDSDSTERYPAQTKCTGRDKEFGSKHHHRSNKHREYVINYDDKNGTVSSIRQIKPGLGTPKRKKTPKEMLKESHKDNALKTKTVDKIALLQLEDHQRDPNGLIYPDRKWKTKVHTKRSCQVL